jgi:hypothetical protein
MNTAVPHNLTCIVSLEEGRRVVVATPGIYLPTPRIDRGWRKIYYTLVTFK